LRAYYEWMYNDSYGSANVDCGTATDSGCWGHREDTLAEFSSRSSLSLGAASDRPGATYTMLLVATSVTPSYYYTWTQALTDGAATNSYSVLSPTATKPIRVTSRGRGEITLSPNCKVSCMPSSRSNKIFKCYKSCSQSLVVNQQFTASVHPKPGYKFTGWSGGAVAGQSRRQHKKRQIVFTSSVSAQSLEAHFGFK
jgi:hypothetical protein